MADKSGQIAWQEMVGERFAQFTYEYGLALIWHVRGRESPIIIDPRIAFGAPTVSGIPTWVIKGRWLAGEHLDDIKDDFHLTTSDIIKALEFEDIQVAA